MILIKKLVNKSRIVGYRAPKPKKFFLKNCTNLLCNFYGFGALFPTILLLLTFF